MTADTSANSANNAAAIAASLRATAGTMACRLATRAKGWTAPTPRPAAVAAKSGMYSQ